MERNDLDKAHTLHDAALVAERLQDRLEDLPAGLAHFRQFMVRMSFEQIIDDHKVINDHEAKCMDTALRKAMMMALGDVRGSHLGTLAGLGVTC